MVYYTVSMKNIAIIYHDADFDGIASNEVCRFHLSRIHPDATIRSYGWDYGRPVPSVFREPGSSFDWADYDAIYIVDLSVDELMERPELRGKIVWIDHHKSAIEKWEASLDGSGRTCTDEQFHRDVTAPMFRGIRIDGVAACRLCWAWFTADKAWGGDLPLEKSMFVERIVPEPELLRLLGEYDVWDRRDDEADALQYGLRAANIKPEDLATMFEDTPESNAMLYDALRAGVFARNYARTVDAQNARAAYLRTLFGIPMIVLNGRGNSKTFDSALERFPEASALCLWYFDGNKVKVSLYHMRDRTDIDLSVFAKQMGGGGHRGACGFTLTMEDRWILDDLL